MHLTFPKKVEDTMRYLKIKMLPRTLFFRTMLLIFIPLIVVQVVSIVAFFDGSWGRVGKRLSTNLTSNMAFAMQLSEKSPANLPEIQALTKEIFDMEFEYYPNDKKHEVIRKVRKQNKLVTGFLEDALRVEFPEAITSIYIGKSNPDLVVFVDTEKGLYQFATSSKNIFSTSIFGFVAWMIGTSLLLFLVAVLFLRIQVRSIADLAEAAEEFGKGVDNKKFKPYGSSEVRRAGIAFIKMKERIQRQISERTQMLAGVSHDLRTPLTGIIGNSSLFLESQNDLSSTEQRTIMTNIYEDSNWLLNMVENLLSVTRIQGDSLSINTTEEPVEEVVGEALEKLKKRYPDAAIRVKIPEEFLMIPMDAVLIEQVTINLLENAIVHSGSILPIDFIVEDHPEHVSFIVRDYGKGLSEEKLQNLFETGTYNNSQSSDSRKGMGIGLSICKTIITAHHGTLSGRNHADGAEFCFTLPKVGVVASEK